MTRILTVSGGWVSSATIAPNRLHTSVCDRELLGFTTQAIQEVDPRRQEHVWLLAHRYWCLGVLIGTHHSECQKVDTSHRPSYHTGVHTTGVCVFSRTDVMKRFSLHTIVVVLLITELLLVGSISGERGQRAA